MAVSFEYESGASRCTIRYEGRIMLSDLTDGIRAQTDAGAWTCETLIDRASAIHGMARMYEATTAQDARPRVEIVFSLADVNPAFERLRARESP